MSSRQSRLLASTDLESFPMWYVTLWNGYEPYMISSSIFLITKNHYIFCYEVLADFIEKMEAYHNFKTLM